ncbi:MAG: hypothetical protein QXR88_01760 [Candidatus Pacearchaeota archaeon]
MKKVKSIYEDEDIVSIFKSHGLICLIRYNWRLGILNGYVVLPKGHKFYGKNCEDIKVDIHGGLTFAEEYREGWVIGFDTAHIFDYIPLLGEKQYYKNIWTAKKVINETKKLAEQLKMKKASKEKIMKFIN